MLCTAFNPILISLVSASLEFARQGHRLCNWVQLSQQEAWYIRAQLPGSVLALRLTLALSIGVNGVLCMIQTQLDPTLKL